MPRHNQTLRDPFASLSRRERQIVSVLLSRGAATVEDVQDAMSDAPGYDAVRTTLRILERKGMARHRRDGKRYVYEATVSRASAVESALAFVVNTFFGGRPEKAALALLRQTDLQMSEAELERLQKQVEEMET